MNSSDLAKILTTYNITVINSERLESTNNVYKICDSNNMVYIFKEIRDKDKLNLILTISNKLNKHGINISKPIPNNSGRYYVDVEEKIYYLSNYIEGETLSHEFINNNDFIVEIYGEVLGRIHMSLNEIISEADHTSLVKDVFEWGIPIIKKNNPGDSLFTKIERRLIVEFNSVVIGFDYQYIHRDYHPGNVLFQDGKFSGIIDFDISVKGMRIFDVCYFLTSTLADILSDEEKINRWLVYKNKFLMGYEKTNKLHQCEKDSIWYIMLGIEIIFAAWFFENKDNKRANYALDILKWIYLNEEKITAT
ncbi:phosphotransferase [Mycoplasmatota bacterium]|nr:phosphotransferase [Mycoplasmatota bacterium]